MNYSDFEINASYFQNRWTATPTREPSITFDDYATAAWMKCFRFLERAKDLRPNWDGENGIPPRRDAIDSLLFYLRNYLMKNPAFFGPSRMAVTADGAIFIEWQRDGRYMDLESSMPGTADFLMAEGDGPPQEIKVRWAIPVAQAPAHEILLAISPTIDPRTDASVWGLPAREVGAAA